MKYSFIKNDKNSFSDLSRVYDVYYTDCPDTVITAIVIGYNSPLEKYFVTMLGENLLEGRYDLNYNSIGEATFIEILYEFFELIPLMTKDDVQNGYYNPIEMATLEKQNIILYSSEMMPYYDEDLDVINPWILKGAFWDADFSEDINALDEKFSNETFYKFARKKNEYFNGNLDEFIKYLTVLVDADRLNIIGELVLKESDKYLNMNDYFYMLQKQDTKVYMRYSCRPSFSASYIL